MEKERSNIAKKIREFRKLKGMTAQDLSKKSGINLSTIKKYETDCRNPKIEQLKIIADALEVSVYEFIDVNINTVGDIVSLLNKIADATPMTFKIDEETGKATLAFDVKEVDTALHDYVLYKNENNSEIIIENQKKSESPLLNKLIMNSMKI